jgi:hypothetical protein
MSRRWTRATAVEAIRPGLERVTLADGGTALAFTSLTGPVTVGAEVLVNTTAVELGLGTGGHHFVIAQVGEGATSRQAAEGHLMKLRYLPLQVKVAGPEDPGDPAHPRLAQALDVGGMPVVCLGLHAQLGPAAAALAVVRPGTRAVYVMTDEAALPAPFSDLAAGLRAGGLLAAVVSAGQAFGGDVEAVTLHSALLLARHVLGAEVVFVGVGPGLLGTGTPFGHGGVAQGEAVNATAAVGGRPIAALRLSAADPRPRHRGLSHHSRIALGRVALAPAWLPVPADLSPPLRASLEAALSEEPGLCRHRIVPVDPVAWPPRLAAAGIQAASMGRGPADDPDFFAAAAAAGALAGQWLREEDGR